MSADAINPNVNVMNNADAGGKIEMNSGSGPVSFEELEEVMTTKKSKKPDAEKAEKAKDEKSQDLTSDTDKGKKPEAKKPDDKKESKDAKASEKPETEDKPAPRKTVKAKYADSELDLDEETLIPVSVNGKEEMWTLKELRADKSGKTAWDKKFTELSKKEKAAMGREMKLQETSQTIKAMLEEKDPDIKMFKMAQLAGVDPVEYRAKFLNDNISLLEKYYSMSEDERKADALGFEARYHKHRADTLDASTKQEHAHRELTAKVNQLRASHQVSEDEFATRYDQITNMVRNGDLEQSQVTPEFIIETIEKDRLWDAAASRLDSLELGIDQQARGQRLRKLVENAHQLGISAAEMPEMVDEIWGSIKAQKKVDEKRKQNDEFLHGKRDVPQMKAQRSEALFFDEI